MLTFDKMVEYSGPFRDAEGGVIDFGDEVVFNRSGDLMRGIVSRVSSVLVRESCIIDGEMRSTYSKPCDIHITVLDQAKVSRVKNAFGILVLEKARV